MTSDPSVAERNRAGRAGLHAAGLWTLIEFGVRDVGLVTSVVLAKLTGRSLGIGGIMTASVLLLGPAMLILAVVFLRLIRKKGFSWEALGYRPLRSSFLPGLIAATLAWGLNRGTHGLTEYLFGTAEGDLHTLAMKGTGLPVLIVGLLPANGVLGPMVEELAWRGYIQTHLTQGWGVRIGIVATALLFALKHVVVDLSYYRIITLVVGGFTYGIVGHRWGVTASTILHVMGNSAATSEAILEILRK